MCLHLLYVASELLLSIISIWSSLFADLNLFRHFKLVYSQLFDSLKYSPVYYAVNLQDVSMHDIGILAVNCQCRAYNFRVQSLMFC